MNPKLPWLLLVSALALSVLSISVLRSKDPRITWKQDGEDNYRELVITTDDFKLDQMYESMEGPGETFSGIRLSEDETSKLFWLKSIQVEAQRPKGAAASNEFFCHANLKFEGPAPLHNTRFEIRHHMPKRLLTLTEGSTDIEFPKGFGIPIHSDTELAFDLTTHQLNHQPGTVEELRFKTRLKYLEGANEDGEPLKALFRRTAYIYDKSLGELPQQTQEEYCGDVSWTDLDEAGLALLKKNPIHWYVPPGEHTYDLTINEQLFLTFDTRIHYAVAHFHSHCEWIRLLDDKTGEVLLELQGSPYPGKRGIANISKFSSTEGIPLTKESDLRLSVKYNNPNEKPIDAMAILYLYLSEPHPE